MEGRCKMSIVLNAETRVGEEGIGVGKGGGGGGGEG